jgi:ketosteroid isomerase-like protein
MRRQARAVQFRLGSLFIVCSFACAKLAYASLAAFTIGLPSDHSTGENAIAVCREADAALAAPSPPIENKYSQDNAISVARDDTGSWDEIVDLEGLWDAAIAALPGDQGKSLLDLLTNDVVILACGDPLVSLLGKPAVREYFERISGYYTTMSVVSTVEQVSVSGGLAVVRGRSVSRSVVGIGRDTGTAWVGEGKFVDALRREDDGTWRFSLSVWIDAPAQRECPGPLWALSGYFLGMSKEAALAVRPADQQGNRQVNPWGGELWESAAPGHCDCKLYLSPSDELIAIGVGYDKPATSVVEEIKAHWGRFKKPKGRRARVSGEPKIRADYVRSDPFCDANVLVSVLYDIRDKGRGNPQMLNVLVWAEEYAQRTNPKKKRNRPPTPTQLWNPSTEGDTASGK